MGMFKVVLDWVAKVGGETYAMYLKLTGRGMYCLVCSGAVVPLYVLSLFHLKFGLGHLSLVLDDQIAGTQS